MKYTKACAEVVLFDNSDVVTASVGGVHTECGNNSVKTSFDCEWSSATGGSCGNQGHYLNPKN